MSFFPPGTPADDKWMAAIREIVRQEVAAALPYSALYDYTVLPTSANGKIDATPADASRGLPLLQGYPYRTGLPGAAASPAPGTAIAVGFLDANPAKPYILGHFDQTGALNITFNTGNGTAEHITTIEGVCAMLVQLGTATAGLGGGWTEVQLDAAIAASSAGILPTTIAAIKAALATKGINLTGAQPSVGCPNLNGG